MNERRMRLSAGKRRNHYPEPACFQLVLQQLKSAFGDERNVSRQDEGGIHRRKTVKPCPDGFQHIAVAVIGVVNQLYAGVLSAGKDFLNFSAAVACHYQYCCRTCLQDALHRGFNHCFSSQGKQRLEFSHAF